MLIVEEIIMRPLSSVLKASLPLGIFALSQNRAIIVYLMNRAKSPVSRIIILAYHRQLKPD